MRVVLYDDETLEALTVLALPSWAEPRLRDGDRIRFPVPVPVSSAPVPGRVLGVEMIEHPVVTVWFERFRRDTMRHGRQESWFAFTADAESSLRLRAVFLPGQQKEVQAREREAVTRFLAAALR